MYVKGKPIFLSTGLERIEVEDLQEKNDSRSKNMGFVLRNG